MKFATQLSLALFLFPSLLFAQNWMPIVLGETYHYRLLDSAHITHSIQVDSFRPLSGDTVFYLNRVLEWHTVGDEYFALSKQGQFLGKSMIKKADGRVVFEAQNFFFDTIIVIFPNANLGESWIAVEDGNILATIESVAEGDVLGETDSLKTIQFSNGATWVLSKNHGLVSAPDYKSLGTEVMLSGLESREIGDRLHRFEDFFDFNQGDILEYYRVSDGGFSWGNEWKKLTILEKIALPDTFQYIVEQQKKSIIGGSNAGVFYHRDTFSIRFVKEQFSKLEAYNAELIDFYIDRYTFSTVMEHGIQFGIEDTPCAVLIPPNDPLQLNYYIDDALVCNWGGLYFEDFRVGLGRIIYEGAGIDAYVLEKLTGAVIQGDTIWGSISPDWFFTKTNEPKVQVSPLKIAPNPASDWVSIKIPSQLEGAALLQIFSLGNKLVRAVEIRQSNDTMKLDLSEIEAGIYFMVLRSDGEIWRSKLVKSR